MTAACSTCRFSVVLDDSELSLACRRFPSSLPSDPVLVKADDWCGEFKAAEQPAGRMIVSGAVLDSTGWRMVLRHQCEQPRRYFIDNIGTYVPPHKAWEIAYAAGQILRRVEGDGPDGEGLMTENLY